MKESLSDPDKRRWISIAFAASMTLNFNLTRDTRWHKVIQQEDITKLSILYFSNLNNRLSRYALRIISLIQISSKFKNLSRKILAKSSANSPSYLKIIPCPESGTSNAACNPRVTSSHEIFSRQSNKSPIKYSTAVQVYRVRTPSDVLALPRSARRQQPFPLVNKE